MPKVKYTYVDSCVFLAYFNQEPGRVEILDQLFEEVQKDNGKKLITSAFSIIEVAYIAQERQQLKLQIDLEETLDAFWSDTSLLEMVDIHENLARNARKLMRQAVESGFSLTPPDALHLVSAQLVGVEEFFTYDQLQRYQALAGFKICEPYNGQPKLF